MIEKNKKIVFALTLYIIFFFAGNFCSAGFLQPKIKSDIDVQAGQVGAFGGYAVVEGKEGALALIQTVINAFLSLIGVILLAYLLSAGYKWMTAHGEEEKVTEAKDTIKRAIVGVIIIIAAYAISIFVMTRLEAGALKGGDTTPTPTPTPVATPSDPADIY